MKQVDILKELERKYKLTYSKQYFSKLVKQGKIPYTELNGRKQYELDKVVSGLQAMQQKTPDGEKFDPKNKDGSVKTINSTKIMLQDYQAKLAQQKFDIEEGLLVYREQVENKAFEVARIVRNQLLTIPERLAGDMVSTTDVHHAKELMYKEINQALEYLSEGKELYE